MRLQENAFMKFAKLLFFTAFFTVALTAVSLPIFISNQATAACLRVRTVPPASDQKKKESEQEATPKSPDKNTTKPATGFNSNDPNIMKATLAIAAGGTPK